MQNGRVRRVCSRTRVLCYHSPGMIRPATIHDVPRVQEVINSHAELGKMLFKSLAQLYEDLRDFAVFETDEASGDAPAHRVVGCVGLTIIWADWARCGRSRWRAGTRGKASASGSSNGRSTKPAGSASGGSCR